MLINISNHPSANWSETQKQSAIEQYGEIMDIPFPHIDPEWTHDQVSDAVTEMFLHLQRMWETGKIDRSKLTMHIMGEMTYCHDLVERFHRSNVLCVASTTKRQVLEEKDGKKTLLFDFVRFRRYY